MRNLTKPPKITEIIWGMTIIGACAVFAILILLGAQRDTIGYFCLTVILLPIIFVILKELYASFKKRNTFRRLYKTQDINGLRKMVFDVEDRIAFAAVDALVKIGNQSVIDEIASMFLGDLRHGRESERHLEMLSKMGYLKETIQLLEKKLADEEESLKHLESSIPQDHVPVSDPEYDPYKSTYDGIYFSQQNIYHLKDLLSKAKIKPLKDDS
jgi:hypothetical protein